MFTAKCILFDFLSLYIFNTKNVMGQHFLHFKVDKKVGEKVLDKNLQSRFWR